MAKKKALKKALEESEILTKFAASNWGKKLQKQAEATSMSDFDRYKAMIAKKKKNAEVTKILKKMQG